jgi:hypothetical protein
VANGHHKKGTGNKNKKKRNKEKVFTHFAPLCFAPKVITAGVVKTLHLRRCCKISIITTYSSTPK